MAETLDKEIRRLLRDWPDLWTLETMDLFLKAGNIELCKQHGTTWVMCLKHPDHGTTGYVKLSLLTTTCIEMFIAGRRKRKDVAHD